MQFRLFVEILPRIAQVERDLRGAGGARGGVGGFAGEAFGCDGGLLVSKRTLRPLPCGLPVGQPVEERPASMRNGLTPYSATPQQSH